MFNKKSHYALNKKNPDAIVCTSAVGNKIELTREDFESEEVFLKWKAISDTDYMVREKTGRNYYDFSVSLLDDLDFICESPEESFVAEHDNEEHLREVAALIAQIRTVTTPKQFRRLWLYYAEDWNMEQIAKYEKVSQPAISLSIAAALRKITEKFPPSDKNYL